MKYVRKDPTVEAFQWGVDSVPRWYNGTTNDYYHINGEFVVRDKSKFQDFLIYRPLEFKEKFRPLNDDAKYNQEPCILTWGNLKEIVADLPVTDSTPLVIGKLGEDTRVFGVRAIGYGKVDASKKDTQNFLFFEANLTER